MRFSFDLRKSRRLRANPRRGVGFEEARELFSQPYWLDQRSDVPEQFLAVGWVVFVGEGPGADEDAQGIPFVGRAGQLLTQMIEGTAKKEGIELLRKDIY